MKITYFGHSCFLVEDGGHSILFDPYENHSVPGLELPAHIETNEVFCSHDHADHNGAELIQSSHDNTWSVHFLTVPHDDESGKKRGFCRITCVDVNGVSVVHMGDIGRDLSEEEYERLKGTDILMIPVGGYYTIDAETAHQIVERLHPSLTLLMHLSGWKDRLRCSCGYNRYLSDSIPGMQTDGFQSFHLQARQYKCYYS